LSACLLYSRPCQNAKLPKAERERKKFEYFLLTRDPQPGKALTGQHLTSARAGRDARDRPCVIFELNKKGAELMAELSSGNLPSPDEDVFFNRHMAIILDRRIVAAPALRGKIGDRAAISGRFTRAEIDAIVTVLRGGLPPKKK
jgi:preprotein translocase subunit SecD